jgi:hypothetical protein
MLYGTELLIAVSVRLLVFGLRVGKRLGLALLFSLLVTALIGVLPPIISVLGHGLSSDFWMGLFFTIIDFVAPCVATSIILAAVPICDDRFAGRLRPTV